MQFFNVPAKSMIYFQRAAFAQFPFRISGDMD
jgi:hypothetical protein